MKLTVGTQINTPSGIITVTGIKTKESNNSGTGYKFGKFIQPFELVHNAINTNLWTIIK